MQQFFIEDLNDAKLTAEQHKQCQKVLRMRKGDQVRLVDTSQKGAIYEFADDSLHQLTWVKAIQFAEPKIKITLIASLIRSERLEWMIQKACEVGVDRIVLYSAQNGVVKDFGARSDRKLERLNSIAKEACEQSYRAKAVEVSEVIGLKELDQVKSELNFYADVKPLDHIYQWIENETSISMIIGPEGGYTQNERTHFESQGYQAISLGNHVLRAETASMVACVLINASGVRT